MNRQNRLSVRALALLLLCLFICVNSAHAALNEPRTWTSADGKYTVRATLVETTAAAVVLRSTEGRRITIAKSKLSKKDRDYVMSLSKPDVPKKTEPKDEKPPKLGKMTAKRIDIDAKTIADGLIWSDDAKSLLVLDNRGTVHKFSVPEFRKVGSVELGGTVYTPSVNRMGSAFIKSKLGLVAVLQDKKELCVIDEDELKVTKRIMVDGATRVAGSPKLGHVVVSDHGNAKLSTVDLKTGRVRQVVDVFSSLRDVPRGVRRHADSLGTRDAQFATMTPDGRYLFASGAECLYKFRISSSGLRPAEIGPRIGQGQRAIEISPDSKHVVLMSGGGNYELEGHKIENHENYIFSVNNLQKPIASVTAGRFSYALAWDLKAQRFYTQNFTHQLVVLSADGKKETEHELEKQAATLQIRVHPDGGKLCVWTDKGLFWVEFANE